MAGGALCEKRGQRGWLVGGGLGGENEGESGAPESGYINKATLLCYLR